MVIHLVVKIIMLTIVEKIVVEFFLVSHYQGPKFKAFVLCKVFYEGIIKPNVLGRNLCPLQFTSARKTILNCLYIKGRLPNILSWALYGPESHN
jgi:hypothetical protein